MPLTVWAQMQPIVNGYTDSLAQRLAKLNLNVSRTQFRIALSRLHIYMYGLFVAEIIDEAGDDSAQRLRALAMLGEALVDDVETLEQQAKTTAAYMAEVGSYVTSVVEALAIPRQLLGMWEATGVTGIDDEQSAELVSMVASAKKRGMSHCKRWWI